MALSVTSTCALGGLALPLKSVTSTCAAVPVHLRAPGAVVEVRPGGGTRCSH